MTPSEIAKVVLAYENGAEIHARRTGCGDLLAWIYTPSPTWNFAEFEYRIKPQAPKKIKVEAWLDRRIGRVIFIAEGGRLPGARGSLGDFIRVPSLDLEGELPL